MAGRPATDAMQRAHGLRLAACVRRLREDRQWSRQQLASAADVSVRTVERLEQEGTANPGFFTVGALADALGVQLDDLLRASRPDSDVGLLSAGYEGSTIDSFVGSLVDRGVSTVADVRLTPISRKPGFSKTKLSGALAEAGIRYRHLRALGNPKENRSPFWEGRLEEGRAVFRDLLGSAMASDELGELMRLAAREQVAVLCFEQDEDRCHRQVICDIARTGHGLAVSSLA